MLTEYLEASAQAVADGQLILAWQHTLNPETGLPCHGWDEKRQQIWADPKSGRTGPIVPENRYGKRR